MKNKQQNKCMHIIYDDKGSINAIVWNKKALTNVKAIIKSIQLNTKINVFNDLV